MTGGANGGEGIACVRGTVLEVCRGREEPAKAAKGDEWFWESG